GKSLQGRAGCRSEEDGGAPQPSVEGRGHGGTRSFKTNDDRSQQKGPRPWPHAGDTGKPFERSVACASSLTPTSSSAQPFPTNPLRGAPSTMPWTAAPSSSLYLSWQNLVRCSPGTNSVLTSPKMKRGNFSPCLPGHPNGSRLMFKSATVATPPITSSLSSR